MYMILILLTLSILFIFILNFMFFLKLKKIHPMFMCVLLIFYTLMICLKMNFMKNSFYYSYILFLVMIGGVMILFMYFTSILINEKVLVKKINFIDYMLMVLYCIFMLGVMNLFKVNFFNMEFFNIYWMHSNMEILFKNLYMNYYMDMTIFLMIYLLFMMICAVLICLKNMVPMRKYN